MPPFHLESNNADRLLCLSGAVTIENAQALHAALVAALAGAATLRIDAREVERVDAAIMQVLLAAARAVPRIEIIEASTAWVQALQRLGISDPAFLTPSIH